MYSMELPSIRTTKITDRFKEAVKLENILYNSYKKSDNELALEICENQILINEILIKALIRMNFNVAIEVAKIDQSFLKHLIESSSNNLRHYYLLFKNRFISLEDVTKRIQSIPDTEEQNIFDFLLFFVPELENPGQYIIKLTNEHQDELMQIKEDKNWEIYKFARDNGYKPHSFKECIMKDDLELFKTLYSSQEDFSFNQKIQESNIPREFVDDSDDDLSIFEYCCKKGASKIFEFFMLNGCTYSQKTLVYSVLGRNKEMIEQCLKNCLLPKNILSYAVRSQSFDAFDMVSAALYHNEEEIDPTDPESIFQHEMLNAFHSSMNIGFSTFFLFFMEQNVSLAESMFYLQNPLFIDSLIENMVSPMALNSMDQTPLFVLDDYDTIKALVEKGCDINFRDKRKKSALNHAASRGEKEKVQFLIKCGAKVEDEFDIIRTCIINGDFDIARILLNAGAPIDDQAAEKLFKFETGQDVDRLFSEDDDIYAVLEKTPDQYTKGQPEQISSDGYSDFDM